MTKNNINYPVPSAQDIVDGIPNSPYHDIASQYWHRKGVFEPTYLHALIAYHEFSKIDHRINKNIKNKENNNENKN